MSQSPRQFDFLTPDVAHGIGPLLNDETCTFFTTQTDSAGIRVIEGQPEKGQVLAITAAYLSADASGGWERKLIPFPSNDPLPCDEIGQRYIDTVGGYHRTFKRVSAGLITLGAFPDRPSITRVVPDTVKRSSSPFIAGHVVMRSITTGAVIDTLAIPTKLNEALTLHLRHGVQPVAAELMGAFPGVQTDIRDLSLPITTLGPVTSEFAAMTTAMFLPACRDLLPALDAYRV